MAAQAGPSVGGAIKPFESAPKRVESLTLTAPNAPAELVLPPLGAEAKAKLDGVLPAEQIGLSRRGDVDAAPVVDAARLTWVRSGNGYASQVRVVSPGAVELRVGLRFTAMPGDLEIRAASSFNDRDVTRATASDLFKVTRGIWPIEHWTATTQGDTQWIELWTARKPEPQQLLFRVTDVSHGFQKAVTFTCHVDIACIPDPNVREDGRAVARMRFVKDGGAFVCTGSLLNDATGSFTPYFVTANHCISTAAVAATLETWFFYYPADCNGIAPAPTRLTGGATLLMADFDTDFSFMRLMNAAPAGAFFLGWDSTPMTIGTPVFGIHHPAGDAQRYMAGTYTASGRVRDSETGITFGQPMSRITITQGIIEGGSSGSPLMTGTGKFRGTLFGSPAGNACGLTTNTASYSDFSIAYPLVSTFLSGAGVDEHSDTPGGATTISAAQRIVAQINRDGDADWFRVNFGSGGTWTVKSFDPATGGLTTDVIGQVYASDGTTLLATNDDRTATDRNFEIVRLVPGPGTYYVRVTGHPGTTGPYGLATTFDLPDDHGNTPATATTLPPNGSVAGGLGSTTDQDWFRITFDRAGQFTVRSTGDTDMYGRLYRSDGVTLISENDDIILGQETNFQIIANVNGVDTYYLKVTGFDGDIGNYGLTTSFVTTIANPNYTDLWWNPSESGWGMNLNHQSDIIFATLFTYAADRGNLWLVGTNLAKQPNGSYAGALYRLTGSAFNAQPFTVAPPTQVGDMTLTFSGNDSAVLQYTFAGVSVTKSIIRQRYGPAPTCTFTSVSRTGANNYQDLWWNPSESGWGINLTQQGQGIFATLFTYDLAGRDMWLVADAMTPTTGNSYTGTLYRGSGPPFNQQPWSAISLTPVGAMTVSFTNGQTGTLTYTVDGVRVVKQIQRQVFAPQTTLCQ
ncbi:hypothetical protein BWI17_15030 [Betaproteobacteria bacterium GR16-43]|nr:hypothetical protein BWI17_15030 [Betaproteobacteria bacterium GR16-43]